MKRMFSLALAASLAGVYFAAETGGATAATEETAAPKSIVPTKYNDGRYKNGGTDPVAEFIKAQSYDKGAVVLSSFYALCRANGIAEDQVAKFEAQTEVEKPVQGAAGRARMTLGNSLRAKARKEGKLLGINGAEHTFEGLAKPAVSGAAAKAQENAGEQTTETVTQDADATGEETGTVETVETDDEVTE